MQLVYGQLEVSNYIYTRQQLVLHEYGL